MFIVAPAIRTGGRRRFTPAVRSGRFTHLIAINVSSRTRIVYVRAKVDAWIVETPTLQLRGARARGKV